MSIEYVSFRPVKRDRSLVGFASFKYDGKLAFNELPIHRRMNSKGKPAFRVLYPTNKEGFSFNPLNEETQTEIDLEISGFICANYPELREYVR